MVARAGIVAAINAKAGTNYAIWRIGLTHDPDDRKRQWAQRNTITFWSQWQLDSLSDAQAIEAHFIQDGDAGRDGWGPVAQ